MTGVRAQVREHPDSVPHSLGRIIGERQGHLLLLSDADNGRTIDEALGGLLSAADSEARFGIYVDVEPAGFHGAVGVWERRAASNARPSD